MKKTHSLVYQFKIALDDVDPAVWRRIQVPGDYTFLDLHFAIQNAMGWQDSHLHVFGISNLRTGEFTRIGIPDEDFDWRNETFLGWNQVISDYFTLENQEAAYTYDFGDDWKHLVRLEAIELAEPEIEYPRCLAGERACPPEDVGGVGGYEDFLHAIKDPEHSAHEGMLEWIGGSFDPEKFDPDEVRFVDPGERGRLAFEEN